MWCSIPFYRLWCKIYQLTYRIAFQLTHFNRIEYVSICWIDTFLIHFAIVFTIRFEFNLCVATQSDWICILSIHTGSYIWRWKFPNYNYIARCLLKKIDETQWGFSVFFFKYFYMGKINGVCIKYNKKWKSLHFLLKRNSLKIFGN